MITKIKKLGLFCSIYSMILLLSSQIAYADIPFKNAYDQLSSEGKGAVWGAIAGTVVAFTGGGMPVARFIGAGAGALLGRQFSHSTQKAIAQLNDHQVSIIQLGNMVEIILPADQLFYPGESTLKYSSRVILNDVAALLLAYDDSTIAITGHSDQIGTWHHRFDFSKQQAEAVMTYLWQQGVDITMMKFYGVDGFEPIADLNTVRGGFFNRRVDIYFWSNKVIDDSFIAMVKQTWQFPSSDIAENKPMCTNQDCNTQYL